MSSAQQLLPARYVSWVAATGVANGVVSAICAAVALPLLVSTLGLARYGEWAVLGMFVTTAAALDLGVSRAIVLHAAGQPAVRVRECATAAAMIVGGITLLAIVAIVGVSTATGRLLGFAPAGFDAALLAGGCAILALGMLNAILRAVLESQLASHWVNTGYLAQTLLFYGLTLLAASFWREAVVIATVIAFGCVLVLHAVILARNGLLRPVKPSATTLRQMMKTGRTSYLLAAPTALLPPLVSMFVLSEAPDSSAFGVFDIASRIATLSATLLSSIAVPVLALSARAQATGMGAAPLRDWVRRYLLLGWLLFALGMSTFWLAGPWVLGWLFPEACQALFPVALALLAGMGAIAASEAAIRAIVGSQDPRPVLFARFLMLAIVLVAAAWILRRGGVEQFAAVYAAAGILCTAMITFAWWRQRPL